MPADPTPDKNAKVVADKTWNATIGREHGVTLPADPTSERVEDAEPWRCAGCGGRVQCRSLDCASGPGDVCKGYCFNDAGCVGKACPGCGKKHYWTYDPIKPTAWPEDRNA